MAQKRASQYIEDTTIDGSSTDVAFLSLDAPTAGKALVGQALSWHGWSSGHCRRMEGEWGRQPKDDDAVEAASHRRLGVKQVWSSVGRTCGGGEVVRKAESR